MPSSYILFHAVDEKRLAVFRKILMNHGSIKNVGGLALSPAPFLRKKLSIETKSFTNEYHMTLKIKKFTNIVKYS